MQQDKVRVALVACSKSKLNHSAPARDIYTGRLFQAARAWAEDHCDSWWILSAEHCLLRPDTVIWPYEASLADLTEYERRVWAWYAFDEIRQARRAGAFPLPANGHTKTEIVFLAGLHYRKYLVGDLLAAGYVVCQPLTGLGYGQQVQFLQQSPTIPSPNIPAATLGAYPDGWEKGQTKRDWHDEESKIEFIIG